MNSIIRYVKDTFAPTSSNISYILHSGGRYEHGFITLLFYYDGQPIVAAKISRGNNELLTKEYENLQKVRSIVTNLELKHTIEEPLSLRNLDGHCVLFTRYVQGLSGINYLLSFFHKKSRYSRLLHAATKWLVDFLNNTSKYHINMKSQKAEFLKIYDKQPHFDYWLENETFFLAPVHGDLTLSNIFIDKRTSKITGVIDFETFAMKGNPIADFMCIITNAGNRLFGVNQDMINRTFFADNSFSREVGKCVKFFARSLNIEIEELIQVLPTYSDREIIKSKKWSMKNLSFHKLLKKNLVGRKDKTFFWLR